MARSITNTWNEYLFKEMKERRNGILLKRNFSNTELSSISGDSEY